MKRKKNQKPKQILCFLGIRDSGSGCDDDDDSLNLSSVHFSRLHQKASQNVFS